MNGNGRLLAASAAVIMVLIGALGWLVERQFEHVERELVHMDNRIDTIRDYVLEHERVRPVPP